MNRHINNKDVQLDKIPLQSKKAIELLLRLAMSLARFCLVHWKEIAVTFYGSFMMGLWIFVAYNKITGFDQNMEGMLRQPFPRPFAMFLAYAIPGSELTAALLIGYHRTRLFGLGLSALLMMAFTVYVGLAILHVWSDKLPCNCGLIIQIGWKKHFVFNVFLLLISSWAFVLQWWILKSKLHIDKQNNIDRYKITNSIPLMRNRKRETLHRLKCKHKHTKE
ncbi:DoxX family protein [Sphingobacterium paramultivorum]|nr:MauE/DoxX family redox-associated membrane protein [Sphingobacterium paramultivorum]WSO15145.1 MauE/DoxX family redox-associated membrane protein [Sphingobacterium paramultivorum]